MHIVCNVEDHKHTQLFFFSQMGASSPSLAGIQLNPGLAIKTMDAYVIWDARHCERHQGQQDSIPWVEAAAAPVPNNLRRGVSIGTSPSSWEGWNMS